MSYSCTYDPTENKFRLYSTSRIDKDPEVYERVKALGFRWAPKQDCYFAPAWTPAREDLLLELCGEIDDEDSSLVDRAETRAERFEEYADHRKEDAERAYAKVKQIADAIPFGQPILLGHHSQRHAERDQARIHSGMSTSVKMWDQSSYWTQRAQAALNHAKYKERPDVRARRIKGLEAEERKFQRTKEEVVVFLKLWTNVDSPDSSIKRKGDGPPLTTKERANFITSRDHISAKFPLADYPRDHDTYEEDRSLWSALDKDIITGEQAKAIALPVHERTLRWAERWLTHLGNRLAYERAMLAEDGGTVADKNKPEAGGACKCWVARGEWCYIQKVNKVSVTVLDNWGNGGSNFTRIIPFDKLTALMSAAEVEAARTAGRIVQNTTAIGFTLAPA